MLVKKKEQYLELIAKLLKEELVAIDTETEEFSKEKTHSFELGLDGVGVYAGKVRGYIPVEFLCSKFQEVLDTCELIFHNAKFDLTILEKQGYSLDKIVYHDTLIMSWLLNENRFSHKLKDLAHSVLKVKKENIVEFRDVQKRTIKEEYGMFPDDWEKDYADWKLRLGKYCIDDCKYTYKLFTRFKPKLEKQGIWKVYEKLEVPTVKGLMDMENRGVRLDEDYLKSIGEKMEEEIVNLQGSIWKEAGKEFDINSPKQLATILFVDKDYKLPGEYRTPTGAPSTNVAALQYLGTKYPEESLIRDLLQFRKVFKLHSTYVKGLLEKSKDGIIHASFKQHGTHTGRLSCVRGDTKIQTNKGEIPICKIPFTNLQNLTILTHEGRYKPLRRIIYKGKDDLYKVTTNKGAEVICTKDHRIYTERGWKKLRDIEVGEEIYCENYKVENPYKNERAKSLLVNGRKNICECIPKERDYTKEFAKYIGYRCTYGKPFQLFLQGKVFKGDERTLGEVGGKGDAGKQEGGERATSDNYRKTEVKETIGRGEKHTADGKAVKNIRVVYKGEHSISWAVQNGGFTEILSERRYTGVRAARGFCGGFGRGFSELLCRPRNFFYKSLRSLCSLHDYCLLFKGHRKKILRLPQNLWKNIFFPYMLEFKQSGVISIPSIISRENTSPEVEGISGREKELFGRFCTNRKIGTRGRWGVPPKGLGNQRKGCEEGNTTKKVGGSDYSSDRQGGLQQLEKSNRADKKGVITAITFVEVGDVWDIEVDDDHSYQAQGMLHHNSAAPNLQNIPRGEGEYDIRKAFVPREGYSFVISDLSQIELRIMAYLSQDPIMLKSFQEGKDIHQETADVMGCERVVGKSVNFGVSYGRTAYGMAKGMDISVEKAEKFINDYFSKFRGIKTLIEQAKNTIKHKYSIQTLFKRKRRFPKYAQARKDRDWKEVNKIERQALNSIVQGSASDIIKLQMRDLRKELQPYDAHILIQIHDELIVEVPTAKAEEVMGIVKHTMENAITLKNVPIVAEPFISDCWKK